jgi:hypothetical protein
VKKYEVTPLFIAFCILVGVMLVLPFFSVDEYVIWRNTTSHLGSQNAPNAWIMNLAFMFIGAATAYEGWKTLGKYWFHKIVITVFAVGLFMTGVFQHAPIIEGISYDIFEDQLHSIFASAVGFSFTLFAFSTAFIEARRSRRIISIAVGLAATGLSLLIFIAPDLAGIWQRIMFVVAFAWLIRFFQEVK